MELQNQLIERRIYSLDIQHKICKEHIEAGTKLCDLVRKYNLSTHSLLHDWLRKLDICQVITAAAGWNISVLKHHLH